MACCSLANYWWQKFESIVYGQNLGLYCNNTEKHTILYRVHCTLRRLKVSRIKVLQQIGAFTTAKPQIWNDTMWLISVTLKWPIWENQCLCMYKYIRVFYSSVLPKRFLIYRTTSYNEETNGDNIMETITQWAFHELHFSFVSANLHRGINVVFDMIRLSSPQTYDTNAQVKLKNQIASQR